MNAHISGGAMDLSALVGAASAQPAGAGQPGAPAPAGGAPQAGADAVAVPSLVFDTTDATFESTMQLSQVVPVVVDLWAEWCQPCKTLGPILEQVTQEFQGELVLAKVDVDANPGLANAFQAQSIPMVVALVAGQLVPLFQGDIPEAQVRDYFTQLLALAKQQGVHGRVTVTQSEEAEAASQEEPVNPAHEPALEAVERGDYPAAIAAYEQVLVNYPADDEAKAALAQVKLLDRLASASVQEIRDAAAAAPDDIEAQMRVADLDVSGGHIEDGFLRLLDLFAAASTEDREGIRARLLELFEVVGHADPRVTAARGRLATLLF